MEFILIACVDTEWGIAKNGVIPWHIQNETEFFLKQIIGKVCEKNYIILGRKIWEAESPKNRKIISRNCHVLVIS